MHKLNLVVEHDQSVDPFDQLYSENQSDIFAVWSSGEAREEMPFENGGNVKFME